MKRQDFIAFSTIAFDAIQVAHGEKEAMDMTYNRSFMFDMKHVFGTIQRAPLHIGTYSKT